MGRRIGRPRAAAVAFAAAADIAPGIADTKAVTPIALMNAAAPANLTDAASIAWDMSTAIVARVTIAGNRTLGVPTNPKAGVTYLVEITQDANGSRTLAFASCWKFGDAGAPTISTAPGATTMIVAYCRTAGATPVFICQAVKGF